MEIRVVIVKKGEEHPPVRLTGPPQERYRAMVTLDGTPKLVLKLFDEVAKFVELSEEPLVIL